MHVCGETQKFTQNIFKMVTKQLILLAWLFLYLKDVNRYKNKIAHNSSDSCMYFKSHFCAWFLILDTNGDWGRMMLGEDLYCTL